MADTTQQNVELATHHESADIETSTSTQQNDQAEQVSDQVGATHVQPTPAINQSASSTGLSTRATDWMIGQIILVPYFKPFTAPDAASFPSDGFQVYQHKFFGNFTVQQRPAIVTAIYTTRMLVVPILSTERESERLKKVLPRNDDLIRAHERIEVDIYDFDHYDTADPGDRHRRLIISNPTLEADFEIDTDAQSESNGESAAAPKAKPSQEPWRLPNNAYINMNQVLAVEFSWPLARIATITARSLMLLLDLRNHVLGYLVDASLQNQEAALEMQFRKDSQDYSKKEQNSTEAKEELEAARRHIFSVKPLKDKASDGRPGPTRKAETLEDDIAGSDGDDDDVDQGSGALVASKKIHLPKKQATKTTTAGGKKTWRLSNGNWKCTHDASSCKAKLCTHDCCKNGAKAKPKGSTAIPNPDDGDDGAAERDAPSGSQSKKPVRKSSKGGVKKPSTAGQSKSAQPGPHKGLAVKKKADKAPAGKRPVLISQSSDEDDAPIPDKGGKSLPGLSDLKVRRRIVGEDSDSESTDSEVSPTSEKPPRKGKLASANGEATTRKTSASKGSKPGSLSGPVAKRSAAASRKTSAASQSSRKASSTNGITKSRNPSSGAIRNSVPDTAPADESGAPRRRSSKTLSVSSQRSRSGSGAAASSSANNNPADTRRSSRKAIKKSTKSARLSSIVEESPDEPEQGVPPQPKSPSPQPETATAAEPVLIPGLTEEFDDSLVADLVGLQQRDVQVHVEDAIPESQPPVIALDSAPRTEPANTSLTAPSQPVANHGDNTITEEDFMNMSEERLARVFADGAASDEAEPVSPSQHPNPHMSSMYHAYDDARSHYSLDDEVDYEDGDSDNDADLGGVGYEEGAEFDDDDDE